MFRNGIETYKLPETVPVLEGQTGCSEPAGVSRPHQPGDAEHQQHTPAVARPRVNSSIGAW